MKIRVSVAIILILMMFVILDNVVITSDHSSYMIRSSEQSKSAIISDVNPTLLWTSRSQNEPLPVNNSSNLVGDHVIVNATFPKELNVTHCEMRIWNVSANVNVTISSDSSTITIDTYYLHHQNLTYNIHVIGNSTNNDTWIIFRQEVEICNFFKPHVIVFFPEALPIDERTYNITWSCTDGNEEEVNYFSIWLSNNDGVSYMLLVQNVTETWFVWNSTGWLEYDYMVRVRAYSIDLTYPGLDLSNPAEGYLPGDYSDGFSPSFEGNGPPQPETTTSETTSNTDGTIPDFTLIIISGFTLTLFAVIVVVLVLKRKN